MELFSAYIPVDRRQALAKARPLPQRSEGTALFADVSGFTPLTEALTRTLGPRRGTEELTVHLNRIYQALIHEVHQYGGSVIAFAGDAITCWFHEDKGPRAVSCAQAMQSAMAQFANVHLANNETVALAVKIGIASGPARRFLAGDPQIQVLDVLAGHTLSRMAAAAHVALRGEIIIAEDLLPNLGERAIGRERRMDAETSEPFLSVEVHPQPQDVQPWPEIPELSEELARGWLIRPVFERLRAGQGEFLTELRPAVALFVKFEGIQYDEDLEAGAKLSAYVAWVQHLMARYEGFLIDVSVGDKGSYLYGCFGAPIAHENDAWRAVTVAHEIATPPADLSFVASTRIGLSCGTMRTGAYGGATRRTYGVLGDEVNLAARLMEHAAAGQVLVSGRMRKAAGESFGWQSLPAIRAKGKAEPIAVSALLSASARGGSRLVGTQFGLELVGRTQELSLIEEKLESALNGHGQVLCLSAEAGMGKSRLIAEAVRLSKKRTIKCCAGECQSHGRHTSYLAWQNVWRELFGLEAADSLDQQMRVLEERLAAINPILTARLPLLGTVLNLPIPENEVTEHLEARLRKSSLESLLLECLRALALKTPLLVVIEDTHWIDSLSEDLLDLLARSISQAPVFLIFTQRPREKGHAQLLGFEQAPNFAEISLGALTPDESRRLIELKLAQLFDFSGTAPLGLVTRLVERSAGNPFYLEELLNYLKDQEVDFEDPRALEHLELPNSLHSLVLSRVDRLTETQQGTLKLASVVGRTFAAAVVWGIQDKQERARIAADLEGLCEAGLTALDRPDPDLAYLFRHVVTQEVTYESLAMATRSKLHTEIGLYLEQVGEERLEKQIDLLAFHFDRGVNVPKRRQYLQAAGHAAQANYANAAAVSYYERVLPLLEPGDRIDVLLRLGKVRELTGEWKQAGACYQRAYEAAEIVADHSAKARSQSATGDLLRKQGLFAEATDWLGLARTAFEELGDQAGVGQVLHAMGTVSAMQGHYDQARAAYQESLQIRRNVQDHPQIASLLSNLGIIARFSAQYEQAQALMEQSLELRRQVGDRWAIANSLNNLGVLLRDVGQLARARQLLEESLELNRQVGDRWAVANTLSSLGEVAIDQRDWPAAAAFLEESLQINQDLGDRTAVAFVLECFATMNAGQGQAARALRLAGAAAALRVAIGSPLSPAEQQRLEKSLESAWNRLPRSEGREIFQEGERLNLARAVAEAISSSKLAT